MANYVDLNTIHNPTTGAPSPPAWGDVVRDDLEALAKPYRCRVRRTTAQLVGHAVAVALVWDTQDYDTSPLGDLWVPGAPTAFTLPVAGVWSLKFNAQFAINATGARILWISTGARTLGILNTSGSSSWYIGGTVSAEEYLAAGTVINFNAYQSSGGNLNIDTVYEIWATARLVSW